ncbi:MAG TPA: iron-sulfur cluster assembly accessory protein [Ferruginibacter sp.]|nr:iron-sulfur cluster assembly accessory protein [Chitinophagaceae bacterium]HRI25250.1 iron-sulfur cluster assembly accessory protein [Ferruginibacter sp.]
METTSVPISFTAPAVAEIKRLMGEESASGKFLRIGVKGGGCSGMTYVLGFDDRSEKDERFDIEGIPVIMERSHGIYLAGMEVDWQDGLNSRGFTFNNPNASKTCGCGTSFAV